MTDDSSAPDIQYRLVTRYQARSSEAADENQARIEAVFAEVAEDAPPNVSYIVLRLDDDSFVHLSFHGHGDDDINPIASTTAFGEFAKGLPDIREGDVNQQKARLVGSYITNIA